MMDLAGIKKFESRGKTVHSHYDGREIQKTFYLEPYSMAPSVVDAMLGSVFGGTGTWRRYFPAQDPEYVECYCNEVKVNQVHPDAISCSDTLELNSPILAAEKPEERYNKFMGQVNTVKDNPAGGCFLTASYRPLISARRIEPFIASPSDEPGMEDKWIREQRSQLWDWIDPHFTPGVRTTPWPEGLRITVRTTFNRSTPEDIPDEVAQPINIPVIEFTVKRLLVGEVPWDVLNTSLNTVNKEAWPLGPYTVPTFPPGTLRFDDFEIVNHYSPFSSERFWHELIYHFLWLDLIDHPVFDKNGDLSGENGVAPVTWNHVLMKSKADYLDKYKKPGWFFASKVGPADYLIFPAISRGPIFTLTDFDPLFRLNP